jgi:cytochrome c-type biogenesis protein CcsB
MNLLGLESKLLIAVVSIYGLSFIFYLVYIISPRTLRGGSIASWILRAGFLTHIALIVTRTVITRHPPFQTLYEALSWFGFSVIIAYLVVEWRRDNRLPGVFVTAIAISALLYAAFGLSSTPKPLPPALQSKWFVWHVVGAFSSYATFVVAFSVEVVFLLLGRRGVKYGLDEKAKVLFHRMAYNLILFGFPLLTFGIVSGAAWAQEAWGGYWFWDPKETWSLITWSVYVLYLHARFTPRWSGKGASVLNILGFVCMIFTFLGVNWLSHLLRIPSLHAY